MESWREYEQFIVDSFRKKYPQLLVTSNDHVVGQFSKVPRQIDVALRSSMADIFVTGVVECKHFNHRVDVKVIDSFIGFLEDVKAHFGVIITNKGFTPAAKNRASVENITLDIVPWDEFSEYISPPDFCQICDGGSDAPPPTINWVSTRSYHYRDKAATKAQFGRCNWCAGIHVGCRTCGSVMAVTEGEYNQALECEGGCGLRFRVANEYEGSGLYEQYLEVVPATNGQRVGRNEGLPDVPPPSQGSEDLKAILDSILE